MTFNPDNPEDGRTEMDVAIAILKADGYRIVKLEHYDTFLDDDPDSVSCGTHQDALMVREEL